MFRNLVCGSLFLFVLGCSASDPDVTPPGSETDPNASGGSAGTSPDGGMISVDSGLGGDGSGAEGVCGNGLLESAELCDDGNSQDADGCSADCAEQDPNYDCSTPGQPCQNLVVCGNSVIEGSEVCDDGNAQGSDGCSADCSLVEEGFGCARPGKPCVLLPVCGNAERERGEECDDGQSEPQDADGCSADCQLEGGFWCPSPGEPCLPLECGDGLRTPDEGCDDAQSPPADGDGCSSQCEVEPGWRCSSSGCSTICGDGTLAGAEVCDDGARASGDGCSAACGEEPFYGCSGTPSSCESTIECGNDSVEPGEICDPPGTDGCLEGCESFSPDVGAGSTCPNSVIEAGEECDPPMVGNGCNAGCALEEGWSCPRPGACFEIPRCGDGVLHAALGEQCDDGNEATNDGCAGCAVQDDYSCYGLEPSVCVKEVCGNGVRTPSEECDDGNGSPGDGCASCIVDSRWACPVAGQKCVPRCGDGQKVGSEQCDDGDLDNDDGCNAGCRVEPGYVCPTVDEPCVPSECGNGDVEPGEGCDDENSVAGDGCGPTCQLEPVITPGPAPDVETFCGDGLITGSEACDDGNDTAGDGCSDACALETGFDCEEVLELPGTVQMQITHRDFKAGNASGGHPDFNYKPLLKVLGIAGSPCTASNAGSCGELDGEGKPTLHVSDRETTGILNADTFELWFRSQNSDNTQGANGTIQVQPLTKTITLTQQSPGSKAYTYDSSSFFPLAGNEGFGSLGSQVPHCTTAGNAEGIENLGNWPDCCDCDSTCKSRNFSFTSELRYFFQYQGGETLEFRGDDDVWVFINGQLAVDVGGMHEVLSGRVILGDDGSPSGTDSNCSAHAVGSLPSSDGCLTSGENDDTDLRFGLTKGEVYEIVLFHAERHSYASNFRLTLSGFLAPRTFCEAHCGDGKVVAGEVCDDPNGNQDGVSGKCNTSCTQLAYCGDGIEQSGEACDNGENLDLYQVGALGDQCAPGCVLPPKCGDGSVQTAYEQCDKAGLNDDTSYGSSSCTTSCELGGYCGDGVVNGDDEDEDCDDGALNGVSYGVGSCGYDCKAGPYCGDGIRNGEEECDGGENCESCKLEPHCGDGVKSEGEDCDYGQFASEQYGGCDESCAWGPNCGDGVTDDPYEECDLAGSNDDDDYGGCSEACTFGPHCGDGVTQSAAGEDCDNGFNDDDYLYTSGACGPGCNAVPSCGDGVVEPAYELCDDGEDNDDDAYDGCSDSCEWGPYCGDGVVDPEESCDEGADNAPYSPSGAGCGYDCQPAPYCGDGERNGSEQCDLGADENDGAYGGCNENCTRAERCGDGQIQSDEGEQCDGGPTGSLDCSTTCQTRIVK
jgi:fibro-slime domain-containing protein